MQAAVDILCTANARRFFAYWDGLPKVDHVPDRADFNPAAIHKLMPIVTLLEIMSPDRVEMRLVGTDLVERMGVDPTGQNYLDTFEPESRGRYLELINTQINHPCGRRSMLHTREASGILSAVEVLSLPMTHARSGHPLIVSCFEPTQAVGFDAGGRAVRDVDDVVWIDIGAGVPA